MLDFKLNCVIVVHRSVSWILKRRRGSVTVSHEQFASMAIYMKPNLAQMGLWGTLIVM